MTDAQDTITIDGFGTLMRDHTYEQPWYVAGDWRASLKASPCDGDVDGRMFIIAHVAGVTHSCIADTLHEAYSRLMASMSDEHVAVIRALGER